MPKTLQEILQSKPGNRQNILKDDMQMIIGNDPIYKGILKTLNNSIYSNVTVSDQNVSALEDLFYDKASGQQLTPSKEELGKALVNINLEIGQQVRAIQKLNALKGIAQPPTPLQAQQAVPPPLPPRPKKEQEGQMANPWLEQQRGEVQQAGPIPLQIQPGEGGEGANIDDETGAEEELPPGILGVLNEPRETGGGIMRLGLDLTSGLVLLHDLGADVDGNVPKDLSTKQEVDIKNAVEALALEQDKDNKVYIRGFFNPPKKTRQLGTYTLLCDISRLPGEDDIEHENRLNIMRKNIRRIRDQGKKTNAENAVAEIRIVGMAAKGEEGYTQQRHFEKSLAPLFNSNIYKESDVYRRYKREYGIKKGGIRIRHEGAIAAQPEVAAQGLAQEAQAPAASKAYEYPRIFFENLIGRPIAAGIRFVTDWASEIQGAGLLGYSRVVGGEPNPSNLQKAGGAVVGFFYVLAGIVTGAAKGTVGAFRSLFYDELSWKTIANSRNASLQQLSSNNPFGNWAEVGGVGILAIGVGIPFVVGIALPVAIAAAGVNAGLKGVSRLIAAPLGFVAGGIGGLAKGITETFGPAFTRFGHGVADWANKAIEFTGVQNPVLRSIVGIIAGSAGFIKETVIAAVTSPFWLIGGLIKGAVDGAKGAWNGAKHGAKYGLEGSDKVLPNWFAKRLPKPDEAGNFFTRFLSRFHSEESGYPPGQNFKGFLGGTWGGKVKTQQEQNRDQARAKAAAEAAEEPGVPDRLALAAAAESKERAELEADRFRVAAGSFKQPVSEHESRLLIPAATANTGMSSGLQVQQAPQEASIDFHSKHDREATDILARAMNDPRVIRDPNLAQYNCKITEERGGVYKIAGSDPVGYLAGLKEKYPSFGIKDADTYTLKIPDILDAVDFNAPEKTLREIWEERIKNAAVKGIKIDKLIDKNENEYRVDEQGKLKNVPKLSGPP